jgi:hypothetical protein
MFFFFLKIVRLVPGANPTMMNYNASAVKICNATSGLVSFAIKNVFFYLEKRPSLCTTYNAGVVVENSEVVGFVPV